MLFLLKPYYSEHLHVLCLPQGSQLVFFNEALEHIVRAARVFRQPGGHMVLVGLDGTGKSSTVQLASHVAGCELYKLTLTRGYSHADFRDDLKKVFRQAGVQGLDTVFLLTDNDIIHVSQQSIKLSLHLIYIFLFEYQ